MDTVASSWFLGKKYLVKMTFIMKSFLSANVPYCYYIYIHSYIIFLFSLQIFHDNFRTRNNIPINIISVAEMFMELHSILAYELLSQTNEKIMTVIMILLLSLSLLLVTLLSWL